ncbi:hypothetical protein ACFLRB_03720 [Acidobacteriota bacterium]
MSSDLSKVLKKMMPALLISSIGLIYFYYLPTSYDFDGTVFSQTLRDVLIKGGLGEVIQAHHPLYYPLAFFIYKALQITAGYNVLEYFHLQMFSFFFGLLTLVFCYKIVRKAVEPVVFQYMGIILIAFSYGFWYYSVEAEVHIAALFFVTAGFYYTFFKFDTPLKLHQVVLSALCFSLAAGFHLTNGLIAVSVCLIFLIEKRTFIRIFQFLSFYFLFFFTIASIFFIFHKANPVDLFKNQLFGKDLLTGYYMNYWNDFSLTTLWQSLKAVAGGILSRSTEITSILSILFFLTALIIIATAWFKRRGEKIYYRLFLWLLPYFLFFSFWDTKKIEFKLNIILPIIILFIVSIARLIRGKITCVLTLILMCIVPVLNVRFVISTASDIQKNRKYLVARKVGEAAPPDSIIVIAGVGSVVSKFNKIYLPYFAHRKVYILDWVLGRKISFADIYSQIRFQRYRGTPILFFSEVTYLSKSLKALLENHGIQEETYFNFLKKLNFKENIPLIDGYFLKPVE